MSIDGIPHGVWGGPTVIQQDQLERNIRLLTDVNAGDVVVNGQGPVGSLIKQAFDNYVPSAQPKAGQPFPDEDVVIEGGFDKHFGSKRQAAQAMSA